jgi:DNA-binding Lrp family transcriptional regulator
MITLPKRVKATFLRLKRASGSYIEIKHIKGYFFVYQSTSRWDKERKKPVKVPLYIGRIANSGELIRAKRRKPRSIAPQQPAKEEQPNVESPKIPETAASEEKTYKYERELLRALSMNGRISVPVLSKIVGAKEATVAAQVKKLEKKYGIKYIAEIDTTKLGYIQFLTTIKFLDTMPKVSELLDIISKDPRVQIVFFTQGDFHLVIYTLARDSAEINSTITEIRKKIHHKSIAITAPVEEDYGFIPLRQEFIDSLKHTLLTREYTILKELIINGKADFSEIDRKYGFDKGRSRYSYYKLKQQGIIKRITISAEKLPIKYIGIIISIITDLDKFTENRDKILLNVISESKYGINKYLLVDDTVSPSGVIFYVPIFSSSDLKATVEEILDLDLGIRTKTLTITDILIGNFCFRNFDNSYSIQEDILVRQYGQKALPKIDYEETGRIKKERKLYGKDIRGLKPET